MKNNISERVVILAYELSNFTLFSISTDYETTEYKILGLPVWKTKELKDKKTGEFKTRYYLCGIPLAEIGDKYEEEFLTLINDDK